MNLKQWLKRLFVPPRAAEPVKDENYWENRARQFGKLATINLSHGKENFDQITRRDEKEIFPVLQEMLSGRECVALDFGCGTGRFTADLAGLIKGKAVGVDPTLEMIKRAPKHKNTEFFVLSDGRIPLPDRSVDLVWLFNVLGCVKDEELARTVAEIERVLADGGILIATENTTEKENVACYTYRRVSDYAGIFPRIALRHIRDFMDKGQGFEEKLSIMAGRKK